MIGVRRRYRDAVAVGGSAGLSPARAEEPAGCRRYAALLVNAVQPLYAVAAMHLSLDRLPAGTRAVVRALHGGQEFAARVGAMGIVIGACLDVLQNANRGPVLVRVHRSRIGLGRGEAKKVLVEQVSA